MYKSFAFAALAGLAAAFGDESGVKFENRVTTELIPGALKLNLYNSQNDATDEVHGELEWVATASTNFNREMGFCIRKKDTEGNADCMRTRFSIDITQLEENPANAQQFQIVDAYATDIGVAPSSTDTDWEKLNDATLNWRAIASKSSKTGCVVDENDSNKASCTSNLSHWYRNFTTSQPNEDIQFADADKDAKFEVWGWVKAYSDDYRTEVPAASASSAAPIEVSAVFPDYITKRDAGTLDAEPEKDDDDEHHDGDGHDHDHDDDKDGATSVTTFGAALIAAICALAF